MSATRVRKRISGAFCNIRGDCRSSNADGQEFGYSVQLTPDAQYLAIGGREYNLYDGSHQDEIGFARVFKFENNDWVQLGGDIIGLEGNLQLGYNIE